MDRTDYRDAIASKKSINISAKKNRFLIQISVIKVKPFGSFLLVKTIIAFVFVSKKQISFGTTIF